MLFSDFLALDCFILLGHNQWSISALSWFYKKTFIKSCFPEGLSKEQSICFPCIVSEVNMHDLMNVFLLSQERYLAVLYIPMMFP